MIRTQLLQAGADNLSTRMIVQGYKPNTISHDEVVDLNLQLKLLHIAAWTGDVDTIREFPIGADLSAKTEGGFTALHLAASRGHSNALRELLHCPGVDAPSVEGLTALHLAAYGGHHESVRLLLDVSDVNAKDTTFGRTALHFAAQWGHERVVDVLTGISGVDICSKDKVRDLTPFLLAAMQPRGRCSLDVVKRLLNLNVGQINDKVGILTDQTADQVVSGFFNSAWRKLTPIEIDNSMRRIPGVKDNVDTEVELYRRFAIPMEGHTALHLAATQNNAELVSHLASRTGVLLNEGDTNYGMTPLHCAIRTGAMKTFRALMAVGEVNVNARLVKRGECKRPAWLPPASAFFDVDEDELYMFTKFRKYDTPLHLAIRVCEARVLMKMVIEFCSHLAFNSATSNEYRCTPLDVAWSRLSFCPCAPSIFKFRRAVPSNPEFVQLVQNYQYDGTAYLNFALDLLERHPSNASVMNQIANHKTAAQSSVNAFLVTATLVAGLTFNGYLQPPFGTAVGGYNSKAARLFWASNSLSFYFAVYTILRSLLLIMRSNQRSDNWRNRSEYLGEIRVQSAVPLTASVGFAVGAFAAAGYGNLPLEGKMLVSTLAGFVLVYFQLIRNLYVAGSSVSDSCLGMSTTETRSDDINRYKGQLVAFLAGPICVPFLLCMQHGICVGGTGKIFTYGISKSNIIHLGFLGIQMYGVLAVVLYSLVTG